MLSSLTPETLGFLQLGSGGFVLDVDLEAPTVADLRHRLAEALASPDHTLGYARNGGCFRCTPALRSPQQAAHRPPTYDDTLLDGWTVTLSGTLSEVSPTHLQRLLPAAHLERTGRLTTLTPQPDLIPEHYIPQLVWVGDTPEGLLAIELTHVLNTPGMALHFLDRGEGTLPFEFRAHGEGPQAPCRILYLE